MAGQLTAFGLLTRKLRVERRERLQDMAERLGISLSFLSAVERGLRNIPDGWAERLQDLYDLSEDDTTQLKQAILDSRKELDITHLPLDDRRLMHEVAESLPSLTAHKKAQLCTLIGIDISRG